MVGRSAAFATRALGPPVSTVRESLANNHVEGARDEIVRLVYPWGEASFYRAMIGSPEERELPQTLVARASIPQVAGLPAIGSSRSSILDDFGSPTSETTDLLYYAWDEGEALPISLRFRFEREHLAEVLWDFGVD